MSEITMQPQVSATAGALRATSLTISAHSSDRDEVGGW